MKSQNESGIEAIADSVIEEVSQCLANQKEYFIVGHSFGSLIAMRIASMLEKSGKIGRLVLIDGSPEYLSKLMNGIFQAVHVLDGIENDMFMMIFAHFCNPDSAEDFVKKLVTCDNISSKLECLGEFASPEYKDKYSKEYLQNMAVAILNRVKLIANLNVEKDKMTDILDTKLKSEITLIRPTEVSFADIDEDYNLNKYTEQKVNIKYVEGHHLSVLENIELTKILNEIISPENSET